VAKVVADFRKTAHLDEKAFRRVFARGGGAPQTVGSDAGGHLMVPTISLHFLVPGLRAQVPDARDRMIAYSWPASTRSSTSDRRCHAARPESG